MRKREKQVKIRLSEEEYSVFTERLAASGQSKSVFVRQAIFGAVVASAEEIDQLKEMNNRLDIYERQLRGISSNINQIAHMANITGVPADTEELKKMQKDILQMRKECSSIWQSLKLLIRDLATVHMRR